MDAPVPLHQHHPDQIRNGVLVTGGTNWDPYRTAAPTPIHELVDVPPVRPEPAKPATRPLLGDVSYPAGLPFSDRVPVLVLKLTGSAKKLDADKLRLLRALPKADYFVVGHAAATEPDSENLAVGRASLVARVLTTGSKKAAAYAYGARMPFDAAHPAAAENARVEIYATDEAPPPRYVRVR